ncbi:MAG: helix-turn-helix domain-containing protein [Pyrinomonadaceae bacterium]
MADLTTKEVAIRFGLKDAAVRQWCRKGLLPNAYEEQTPRGALWRIPEADLMGFTPPRKTGRPPKVRKEAA